MLLRNRVPQPLCFAEDLRTSTVFWLTYWLRWLAFAVPVIGGLILETIMQRRLNQVWEVVSPQPAARISSF